MVMTDQELESFCSDLGLDKRQIAYIKRMRKSSPVRDISANRKHGVVKYASSKMGMTIPCESRNLEHFHVVTNDTELVVKEQWAQPDLAQIANKKPGAGPNAKIKHYVDSLVVYDDCIKAVEYKHTKDLEKIHKKEPWKISIDEDGRYRNLAAEEYYADYGISYEIRTELDIDRIEVANLDLLEPYFSNPKEVDKKALRTIRELLKAPSGEHSGISVLELLSYESVNIDDIYQGVASGIFYCDLSFRPLTEQSSFYIFTSHEEVERFKSERVRLTDAHRNEVEHSPGLPILLKASDDHMTEAHRRLKYLEEYWVTGIFPKGIPESTFYDYQKYYRLGKKHYGSGFIGLIPLWANSGPTESTLLPGVIDLFLEKKKVFHDDKTKRPPKVTFTKFNEALEENGYAPIHRNTFYKLLRIYETRGSFEAREGYKRANTEYGSPADTDFSEFKKGLFPWHMTHMDHTQMDLNIRGGYFSGLRVKPWLTTLFDPLTDMVGAWYITLEHPSVVNSLMTLRRFVHRYGFVPRYVVLDGGKDFNSIKLEQFLAFMHVSKVERRTSTATDGTEEERLNLTINNEMLYAMRGNNQLLQSPRDMDPKDSPLNDVVWTLQSLELALDKYFNNYYHLNRHDGIGCTPLDKYNDEMAKVGERTLYQVKNLDQLDFLTRPRVRRNKGCAQATRHGLRMQHAYYGKQIAGQKRYRDLMFPCAWDADDLRYGYAQIGKSWGQLTCDRWVGAFKNLSPLEVSCASREYRFMMSKAGKDENAELRLYAEFLHYIGQEELLLEEQVQRLSDAAKKTNQRVVRANQRVSSALDYPERGRRKLEVTRD